MPVMLVGINIEGLPSHCRVFVLAPPKPENLHDVEKMPMTTRVLYLPPYSLEELHAAKVAVMGSILLHSTHSFKCPINDSCLITA